MKRFILLYKVLTVVFILGFWMTFAGAAYIYHLNKPDPMHDVLGMVLFCTLMSYIFYFPVRLNEKLNNPEFKKELSEKYGVEKIEALHFVALYLCPIAMSIGFIVMAYESIPHFLREYF